MKKQMNCHNRKTHKMDHYLEICLLMILIKTSSYGYDLLTNLSDFGFTKDELNAGTLYRVLRRMEEHDLVSSAWEPSSQGPDKRIYEITILGKKELNDWIHMLKERQERISFLINCYEEVKKQ
ncbi:MAG: PadR family transcriptional regulator [Candidatus Izemoplasmatales bacterium]